MAAMVTSINRVNGIFERDFGVTMQIIPENDSLLFLDPESDPYTTGSSLNDQLQNTIDNDLTIGTTAYDVGHLFHSENAIYGNAGCIACVCTDGKKGSAFTTHSDPSSDHFNMIVAHEFGHQFGGYHVQSSSNCRSGFNSEVEPGSGSTIMGYAGICPTNVQNEPDDYFNYVDIRDVAIWTITNSSCAEIIATGNSVPVVDAGNDYVIPKSTAFILEGTATDSDGDTNLTYCWEQNDPEDTFSSSAPQSNWVNGPLFRSKLPVDTPIRYMPQLDDVLMGNLTPTWEVIPSVARTMQFELTVRDNILNGGQTNTDSMQITVDANAGPFIVTSQSTVETWNVGDQVTVNWDVANTDRAPVNTDTVDILLSIDGGYTYPYILQDDTENDGSQTFSLPNVDSSTSARIMIRASNSIFFAVNAINFTVQASEFVITTSDFSQDVCQSVDGVYDLEYLTFLDFNEEVTFSVENLPIGAQATFNPPIINGSQLQGTPIVFTITDTENIVVGSYNFLIKGISNSGVEKVIEATLEVYENTIIPTTLETPLDNEIGFDIELPFVWSADINTKNYEIEIATTTNFSTIIESSIISENNYIAQNLNYDTEYYWRVRNINSCGVGEFSQVFSFTTKCSTPENFKSVSAGPTYIGLEWLDENSSAWEIEYGTIGFEIGTGTRVSADTQSYEVTELNSLISYDFYLRSTCTVGGTGIFIGPITVSTTGDFCAGDHFYDPGGVDGDYPLNEISTTVISPSISGERVRVVFNSFNVESGWDFLKIYDGPDDTYPRLHEGSGYTGTVNPGTFIASDASGSLTFVFYSDSIISAPGWDATVICEPFPNCNKPTEFVLNNVDDTSVTLSWLSDDQASSWNLEYGYSGFDEGSGTVVTSNDLFYTIPNLEPKTLYDVYIRGNCVIGGVSDLVGPITFETLCSVTQAPFIESFEAFNIPECWSTANSWNYNLNASYDASQAGDRNISRNTNYAWVDGSYPNGENQVSVLSTPLIDISTLTEPSIQFSVFSKNTIDNTYNTLMVEFYDGVNWNIILQIQENTAGWRDVVIDLEAYTISGSIQVRFTVTKNSPGNSEYNDILIDEIKVDEMPSCLNPYQLEVSNIKGRSATISWIVSGDESNWELQYGPQGFTPSTAINEIVTENPYEISELQPTTNYEVYLRSVCGIGDNGDFIGPLRFTTDCDPFDVPFIENFTEYSRPQCWQEEGTANWAYSTYYDGNLNIEIPDRTIGVSTKYTWKYNNGSQNPSYLLTPYIDITSLTVPSVQFSIYSNETVNDYYGTLIVEFFDGADWNTLLTFSEATQGWKDYYFDISSYTITDDIKVRFGITENVNSGYNYILIDDVKVEELPTCFSPNGLSFSNVTNDSVEVSWETLGIASSWELHYGPYGFAPGTESVIVADTNTNFTIPDLIGNTRYQMYIRSDCGAGDYSNYVGPITFTTECDPYEAPFIETFIASARPLCWEEEGNSTWRYGTYYDSNISMEIPDRTVGGQTNYMWNNNSYTQTPSYIMTPAIDVSSLANPSVQFSLYSNQAVNDYYSTMVVEFFDGVNWNTLLTFEEATNGWKEYYYDISSYTITGDIKVRFGITENAYSGYNYILIDDVTVEELPTCFTPDDVSVSDIDTISATIHWTPIGDESMWDIEYGISGFTPGFGTIITVTEATPGLNNLLSGEFYDVYVRANCGTDDVSRWTNKVTFKTTTDYCAGAHFYDSGGAKGNYSNGENETTVISPDVIGDRVRVIFDSFRLEGGWDYLRVYDGPDISVPLIGSYSGNSSPGEIVSSHETGTLTFVFTSDSSVVYAGWDARVICEPMPNCDAPESIVFTNILSNRAEVAWMAVGSDISWEVEYGLAGFDVESGTVINTNTNLVSIENLSPNTTYDVYIKTVCNEGGFSEQVGPYQFSTIPICDPIPSDPFEYVQNGSFECGDFTSWTSTGPGSDMQCRMNFTVLEDASTTCLGSDGVLPSNGNFAAFTSFEGMAGDEFILEQVIRLPEFRNDITNAWITLNLTIDYVIDMGTPTAERELILSLLDESRNVIDTSVLYSFGINQSSGATGTDFYRDVTYLIENYPNENIILQIKAFIPDDYTGAASAMVDNVSFKIEPSLSNQDEELMNNEMFITPNPNNGSFVLGYKGQDVLKEILIFDVVGNLIVKEDLTSFTEQKQITLTNAQAGMYFAKIVSGNGTVINKKIIVE